VRAAGTGVGTPVEQEKEKGAGSKGGTYEHKILNAVGGRFPFPGAVGAWKTL
jgi:hypothetical protein